MALARFWRVARNVGLVAASTVVALSLAEVLIRATDVDWRYARRLLYYQNVNLPSMSLDPDPAVRYRLKPGVENYGAKDLAYRVEINSLGYRGPERPAAKPPGVFRILVVGGSNVYGSGLSNEQTWPLQLERRLNGTRRRRFEAWNAGAPAYVARQMMIVAEEALRTIDPDLIVIALSNTGRPAFLRDSPVAAFFARDPWLWTQYIPPRYFSWPSWPPLPGKIRLLARVRLYRFALLAGMAMTRDDLHWEPKDEDEPNLEAVRTFIARHAGRVRLCFFVCPGCQNEMSRVAQYYERGDAPVLVLSAAGLPEPYRKIHPPASVMAWYADNLADWLVREKLVP